MQSFMVSLIGLVLSVSVGAEPLKGRVWLASGPAAAGVQVRLFDLTDLRRSVGTTTDEAGYFALPLASVGGPALPQGFALGHNYPNPFNPSTIIPYQLPTATHVRLEVFNLLGQRLATLVDGERSAGAHTARWDATDAAGQAVGAGVYIYRLTGDGHTVSRRMVLIDGQAGIPAGAAGPGPMQTAAVGVKTEGSVYGLTVAAEGFVAYVDPAFQVGSAKVDLVLAQPGGPVRMKVATGGILGDVNNDGQVDEFDVLYVALYSKDPSITLPNNGDISLGDVNGDGTVDLADGLLLALYKVNPSDPTLPPGIGQPADGSGDDHGDSPSAATALAVGGSRSGQLETGGDVDYFRVEVTASGELTVHTTGSLDTKGQLEDSAGAVLASDDDGGDDYNFRLAHAVSAGTYYIKVVGYNASATGRYTIHASGPGPDLIVASASVSDNTLTPAQSFTLNATVRNQGTAAAAATTMRSYQSPDATITADDSPVGTGTVSGLSADHTSAVSIDLTAPSRDGTYYYGACVQSVRDESNTDNNCSPGVQVTVADGTVNIADANLRAAIAAELGKASGAPITKGEMTTLTRLNAANKGIRNLAGLEFATNLTTLWLEYNSISDVSPLAGLTRLRHLDLSYNNISDISPLRGLTLLRALDLGGNNISDISPLRRRRLTYLRHLDLEFNNISDISPLRGLTLLSRLNLEFNNISDISPLRGMTRLLELDLEFNNISDVSPLRGLTYLIHLNLEFNNVSDVSPLRELTLDELYIRGNPLSVSSINEHIAALERRGATVRFDPPLRESDFDIELVFLDDAFSERHKRVIQYAARRWMSIIREDLPDYTLTGGWSEECGEQSYRIPSGERIDDLRIYVTSFTDDSNDAVGGWAGPDVLRETSHLSVVGCMGFNLDDNHISLSTALHEIGHVLGVGTSGFKGFLQDPNGDPHFNGPRAIAAFNAAGGRNYTGQKVPVEEGGRGRLAHWRSSVFRGELMDWTGGPMRPLSAITIQALADIGYSVDVTQADPYTLPSAAAKVVAAGSTPDDRLPGRLAPERTCGAGQQREPIYVIDPQGRIVRTLHR